jgi:thiamine biosynthesis lipoprotein
MIALAPPAVATTVRMDTMITIHAAATSDDAVFQAMARRAFAWFDEVERVCSRFDPNSEVMQLAPLAGTPVRVSPILAETLGFALEVARMTRGAFDPTIGVALERRGFNRHYVTGNRVSTTFAGERAPTYRDVQLDRQNQTVTLRRPLVLDLGAVAKGFAIDLAARELRSIEHFSIDAGGDIFAAGHGPTSDRWRIGIQHPRDPDAVFDTLAVSDVAVCTTGDYERRVPDTSEEHHVIDARTGTSPQSLASVTVVAPNAMLADALSTAAFILGAECGSRLLQQQGLVGLFVSSDLRSVQTPGFGQFKG